LTTKRAASFPKTRKRGQKAWVIHFARMGKNTFGERAPSVASREKRRKSQSAGKEIFHYHNKSKSGNGWERKEHVF